MQLAQPGRCWACVALPVLTVLALALQVLPVLCPVLDLA